MAQWGQAHGKIAGMYGVLIVILLRGLLHRYPATPHMGLRLVLSYATSYTYGECRVLTPVLKMQKYKVYIYILSPGIA